MVIKERSFNILGAIALTVALQSQFAEARAKLSPLHVKASSSVMGLLEPSHDPDNKSGGATGPASADLHYFGGAVLANVKVVAVMWGSSVDAKIQSKIGGFYASVVDSPYMDWLSEYDTNIRAEDGRQGTNQHIGRGSFVGKYVIKPASTSSKISDATIQKEIDRQIAKGALPSPDANTIYMVHFPVKAKISQGNPGSIARSCVDFCAYHSAFISSAKKGQINYGVMPDMNAPGCNTGGCGDGDSFSNLTNASSHELIEAVTDSGVGLATGNSAVYPMGWYDNSNGEIGDICASETDTLKGKDGSSYTVQKEWSNVHQSCVSGL